MIEVSAKLHSIVFLAGETVKCSITFFHPPLASHKMAHSHTDAVENLAWAAAQIHCLRYTTLNTIGKQEVKPQQQQLMVVGGETALGASEKTSDTIEFATKPKILFCDLHLASGLNKTFVYEEKLPNDGPPSYRGQLIRYSYKLVVSTQRVNSPIKLLKLPFRVLPLNEVIFLSDGGLCNDTTDELTPTNPFLDSVQRENGIEMAIEALQNITARRHPNFYMISNTWGKVARFCLFKPAYRLGEDIIGTFDFTVGTVHCVQVSVSLQCEEELVTSDTSSKQHRLITFSKHHEVCLGYNYTQLILPIPLHATPDFATNLVTLKWQLHFEFVTSTSDSLKESGDNDMDWRAPSEIPIETMVWSLPIKLYSTTPINVAQGIHSNSTNKLLIR